MNILGKLICFLIELDLYIEGLMPEGRKCTFCSFEKIEVKGFGQSEFFFGTTYSIEI